jgi:hypothetical protein
MEQVKSESISGLFPSVELAYPIAVASYESIIKRIDALENRTQTMMAFAATLTVAIPAMTAGRGLTFRSGWFITALVLFAVANVIGVVSRLRGDLLLLSPKVLFDNYLVCSDWEFKKETIFWAGNNFSHNNTLLLQRHRLVVWMNIIFSLEAVALAVWAAARI